MIGTVMNQEYKLKPTVSKMEIAQTKKSPHSPTAIFECEVSTFHVTSNGKDDKKIQL